MQKPIEQLMAECRAEDEGHAIIADLQVLRVRADTNLAAELLGVKTETEKEG